MPTETTTPTAEAQPTEETKKVKQVQVEVYRKSGKTYFKFAIDKNLETIFENQSGGATKQSNSWPGLSFYYIPKMVENPEYKAMLQRYNLFDDFGHAFIRNGNQFNIAFVRTVDGKGQVELKEDIPFALVIRGLRDTTRFLKEFHEEFLQDYKVKAELNLEV